MTEPKEALAEGRAHLRKSLEDLEAIRWQLLGIKNQLPESAEDQIRQEDLADETDSVRELRTVIECVLTDNIRPAIRDLQNVLESTEANPEEL